MSQQEYQQAAGLLALSVGRAALALKLSQRQATDLLAEMVNGLTLQLVNLPVDMRIEPFLWETYPGLRPIQERSLRHETALRHKALDPLVRKFAPRLDYTASNAMNCAWCKGVAELLRDPKILAPYTKST